MKSFNGLIAVTLFVSAAVSGGAPAAAQATPSQGNNAQVLEFCYSLIASGNFPDLNLGECMAFNLTPDPGFKALFCDYLRETGQLEDAGVTYSQCIRAG